MLFSFGLTKRTILFRKIYFETVATITKKFFDIALDEFGEP